MIQAKEGLTIKEYLDKLTDGKPGGLPLSRPGDPEPSHNAADAITRHLQDRQRRVLALVFASPGRTTSELTAHYEYRDPRMIGRRLPELERMGLVFRGEPRKCEITGHSAAVWYPFTEQKREWCHEWYLGDPNPPLQRCLLRYGHEGPHKGISKTWERKP